MFYYCVSRDKENEKVYLVSDTQEDIDSHCKENDLEVLSTAPMLAEAIRRNYEKKSISSLFPL